MRRFACCLAAILLTAGCATHREPIATTPAPDKTGTAELQNIQAPYVAPPEGRTEKATPLEIPPQVFTQPLPEYPDVALEAEVHCTARLLYHTEIDGSASFVRLEWDDPPPVEYLDAFELSIKKAVGDWAFAPAQRITPTQMDDGSIEPRSKAIRYAGRSIIRFRVESGEGVVE